jgi:hypothetical protein
MLLDVRLPYTKTAIKILRLFLSIVSHSSCFVFIVTPYEIQLTLRSGEVEVMDDSHTANPFTVVLRKVARTDRVMNLPRNLEGMR